MIAAGFRYFAIVFAVAFAFGTIRTLWLTAAVGATVAVLIEVPLILIVSLVTARSILRRRAQMSLAAAAGAGAIAFALLMASEAVLATTMFGMSFTGWLASLIRMPGPIGLAGQILFAAMPAVVRATRRGS